MDKKFSLKQIVTISLITAVAGAAITAAIFMSYMLYPRYNISFDSKTVSLENIKKFEQVREILKKDYYKGTDENKMIEGATSGLAESLQDPYTVYFNKEQMASFMEKSEGSYVGIGVTINEDENGILTVVEPFDKSPAQLAGVLKGDKIVKVGDKDVTGIKDSGMVISMIKGVENTKVKVTMYRPSQGKYIDFDITRKKIKIENIKSEVMNNDIGYIKINTFDQEIAKDFTQHLNSLLLKGIKGLMIDLRDNPGGSYDQVVAIADKLLPEGIIVYTEDKNKVKEVRKSDSNHLGLPIVVLINGNSASASEILAGALKDHNMGKLVGTKSFGKGLVQELKMLQDGSGLKVTIARYFTPSGVCIQGKGISPDIEVDLPAEYRDMPVSQVPRNKDSQLKTGLETLKDMMNKQ